VNGSWRPDPDGGWLWDEGAWTYSDRLNGWFPATDLSTATRSPTLSLLPSPPSGRHLRLRAQFLWRKLSGASSRAGKPSAGSRRSGLSPRRSLMGNTNPRTLSSGWPRLRDALSWRTTHRGGLPRTVARVYLLAYAAYLVGTANLLVQSQGSQPSAHAAQALHLAKVGGLTAAVVYALVLYVGCAWAVEPRRAQSTLWVLGGLWNALCEMSYQQQRGGQWRTNRHDRQYYEEQHDLARQIAAANYAKERGLPYY
jgi:hypothetical protein